MVDLGALNRRELQYLAKELNVCRANAKSDEIVQHLTEYVQKHPEGNQFVMDTLFFMPEDAKLKTPMTTPSRNARRPMTDDLLTGLNLAESFEAAINISTPMRRSTRISKNTPLTQPRAAVPVSAGRLTRSVAKVTNQEISEVSKVEDRPEDFSGAEITTISEEKNHAEELPKVSFLLDSPPPSEDRSGLNVDINPAETEVENSEDASQEKRLEFSAPDHSDSDESEVGEAQNIEATIVASPLRECGTTSCEVQVESPVSEVTDVEKTEAESENHNDTQKIICSEEIHDVSMKDQGPSVHLFNDKENMECPATTPLRSGSMTPKKTPLRSIENVVRPEVDDNVSNVLKKQVVSAVVNSEENEIAKLVAAMDDLSFTVGGKVHCSLTGHDMMPRKSDIAAHLKGKKYRRAKEMLEDLSEFQPFFIEHADPQKDDLLYCTVTEAELPRSRENIMKHMSGANYKKCLPEWRSRNLKLNGLPTPKGTKVYFSTPTKASNSSDDLTIQWESDNDCSME